MSKIYVSGLSLITNEDVLKEGFKQFGTITEIKIIYDKETGYSKGFAFITFNDQEAALMAEKSMNQKSFDGRILKVSLAKDNQVN